MQINTRKPRKWGQLLDTTAPEYLIFSKKIKTIKIKSVGRSVSRWIQMATQTIGTKSVILKLLCANVTSDQGFNDR